MKTFQFKDWSEDMLTCKAEAIAAEFECELVALYRDAELGEIDSYNVMIGLAQKSLLRSATWAKSLTNARSMA